MTLAEAVEQHDIALARRLLASGASPDAVMPRALAIAMHEGPEMVALLVEHGADGGARDPVSGTTPLMHVAAAGDEAAVDLLLEYAADPLVRDAQGRTFLDWAVDGGAWRLAARIVERGITYRDGAVDRLAFVRRGIEGAARHAREADLRAALAVPSALTADPVAVAGVWALATGAALDGGSPAAPASSASSASSAAPAAPAAPVVQVAESARLAVVALVEEWARREAHDPDPWRLADRAAVLRGQAVAASAGARTLVRGVLARMLPLSAAETQLLIDAAAPAVAPFVRWLVEEGATAADGQRPPHAALLAAAGAGAQLGIGELPVEAVRAALNDSADVDARGAAGETAAMLAARRHDVPQLRVLLAHGANVHARDMYGRTAMAYADHVPDVPSPEHTRRTQALLREHGARDQRWTYDDQAPAPLRDARRWWTRWFGARR